MTAMYKIGWNKNCYDDGGGIWLHETIPYDIIIGTLVWAFMKG